VRDSIMHDSIIASRSSWLRTLVIGLTLAFAGVWGLGLIGDQFADTSCGGG
jgi:hypothetical protein